MTALVLDAGAFIAFERGAQSVRAQLAAARQLGLPVVTTSPIVAQVWRDGAKQALLVLLLRGVEVIPPTLKDAQYAGDLCRRTRSSDAVDALLVATAPIGSTILTSDPSDIRALVAAARRSLHIEKV